MKNLHHAAKSFDIGVYFEANGHGTVLFSPQARQLIAGPGRKAQHAALGRLGSLMNMTNDCVGDALSDLLLVEAILAIEGKTMADWEQDYTELPSCMLKYCSRMCQLETEDAERRVTYPPGIQGQIDQAVGLYPLGRCFIRMSGTESAVRIYAEADLPENAQELALRVERLLEPFGGY